MTGEEMSKAKDLTVESLPWTRELSPSVSSLRSVFSVAVKAVSPDPLLAQHVSDEEEPQRAKKRLNELEVR